MGRHTIICWRSPERPLDWTGQDTIIVASGPSAKTTQLEFVRDRARVIALNSSWRLVPWADVLYGTDGQFWFHNDGVPQFTGRKFTSSINAGRRYALDVLLTTGNNSGHRAIHLAEALNAKRILLVGFDMHDKNGVHWHEPHRGQMLNPTASSMRMWCTELHKAAVFLNQRGTRVINCTPGSALQCFPIMMLNEALRNDQDDCDAGQPRRCAVL